MPVAGWKEFLPMSKHTAVSVIASTNFVRLVQRDGWSYVSRIKASGVVCIVPLRSDGHVVLVEQHRPAVGVPVVEWPAGLAGDAPHLAAESLEDAARRELLEETGYRAGRWRQLATVASSPGLTDEIVTFFLAEDAERIGSGGGDQSEDILVHEVPLADVDTWLSRAAAAEKLVDARVYSGLYFLHQGHVGGGR